MGPRRSQRRAPFLPAASPQQRVQARIPGGRKLGQQQRQIGAQRPGTARAADAGAIDGVGDAVADQEVVEVGIALDQSGAVQRAQQGQHGAGIRLRIRGLQALGEAMGGGQELAGQQPGAAAPMVPADRRAGYAAGVQQREAGAFAAVVAAAEEQLDQQGFAARAGAKHQAPAGQVAIHPFGEQRRPPRQRQDELCRRLAAGAQRFQSDDLGGTAHRCDRATRRASAALSRSQPRALR